MEGILIFGIPLICILAVFVFASEKNQRMGTLKAAAIGATIGAIASFSLPFAWLLTYPTPGADHVGFIGIFFFALILSLLGAAIGAIIGTIAALVKSKLAS